MSSGHLPYWPHRKAGRPPTHEEQGAESSGFPPEGPLQTTAPPRVNASVLSSSEEMHIYQLVPEQHFWAAMLSSTSVHFGEAILDWMALEDTTLLRKTRKSPRCSSAVCCLRIKAGTTQIQIQSAGYVKWNTNPPSLSLWEQSIFLLTAHTKKKKKYNKNQQIFFRVNTD